MTNYKELEETIYHVRQAIQIIEADPKLDSPAITSFFRSNLLPLAEGFRRFIDTYGRKLNEKDIELICKIGRAAAVGNIKLYGPEYVAKELKNTPLWNDPSYPGYDEIHRLVEIQGVKAWAGIRDILYSPLPQAGITRLVLRGMLSKEKHLQGIASHLKIFDDSKAGQEAEDGILNQVQHADLKAFESLCQSYLGQHDMLLKFLSVIWSYKQKNPQRREKAAYLLIKLGLGEKNFLDVIE